MISRIIFLKLLNYDFTKNYAQKNENLIVDEINFNSFSSVKAQKKDLHLWFHSKSHFEITLIITISMILAYQKKEKKREREKKHQLLFSFNEFSFCKNVNH